MTLSTAEQEPEAFDFGTTRDGQFDLVGMLLEEQQQLTAVEQFCRVHETDAEQERLYAEPVQAKYYRSLLPSTSPNTEQQYGFEVDLDSCSGCKACVVACHTLNGLEEEESWRRVGAITIGHDVERADHHVQAGGDSLQDSPTAPAPVPLGIQHVTTACHHCREPGCLHGCPVKAYDKDPVTGIVRHLDDQCIGCKYCTMMCPYEVPKYSQRLGIVRKCDMCHHRLAAGEAPACVQACPNEAIRIRLVDRQATIDFGSEERLSPGAPPSEITQPTTNYKTAKSIELAVAQDAGLDDLAESHWPLAAMLIATQISVGMLVIERLLAGLLILNGDEMPAGLTATVTLVALIVGVTGLGLAPLHLGQPLRAWRVFLGLRTSWLSREAVVLGKFIALLSLATILWWLPRMEARLPEPVVQLGEIWLPAWLPTCILMLSMLIGILGAYCSAMIYIATRRPLWRWRRTMARFAGTLGIGGCALTLAIVASGSGSLAPPAFLTPLAMAGWLLAGAGSLWKLVWEWRIHLGPVRPQDHPHDRRCRRLVQQQLSGLKRIRLVMGIASGMVLMLMSGLVLAVSITSPAVVMLGWLAAGSVLASESLERLLYFKSVVYDRMPGGLK